MLSLLLPLFLQEQNSFNALNSMNTEFHFHFPKGASKHVELAAVQFSEQYGKEALFKVK